MKDKIKINKKYFKNTKDKRGITLIALIITVIILLILAGTVISISIYGGGIFGKTAESREMWNAAVETEENSLKDSLYLLDIAANPDLAKSKLLVKVNADGTIDSPYYVNYPSAKGTIKCRVLYNDSTYGLQLVSVEPVKSVTIGPNDPNENVTGEMGTLERAQSSYNRAVTTLNENAEEYIETENGIILAKDARCIGSNPLDKNYPENLTDEARSEKMYVAGDEMPDMEPYNGLYFDTDENYYPDNLRLSRIGAKKFKDQTYGRFCHLASHKVYIYELNCTFRIPQTECTGPTSTWTMWEVKNDGTTGYRDYVSGLRPVFVLADGVKIVGGKGTEEVPYELGL